MTYMQISILAADMERQQEAMEAKILWRKAIKKALNPINREWAEIRAALCDTKIERGWK